MRRLDSGAIQRFEDNKWQSVKTEDVAVLGKVEAQIWLSLYNLLMDPTCRKTYAYTKHNQGIVLRLKDLYEETLVISFPILLDVRRYLEELTMLDPPESISAATGHKGIELVPPEITDMAQDWRALAEQQKRQVFTETDDSRKKSLERLAKLYDFDELDSLVEPPKCGKCGKPAMQRCSKCRTEWYCSRPCQVKAWPAHKSICSVLEASGRT